MARVDNVAAYILKRGGAMTAMKLHRLLYYAQSWSLVWDKRRLFGARIEAWANGPIVPIIYRAHQGEFKVKSWRKGDSSKLSRTEAETVDAVLDFYLPMNTQWLSDLARQEAPWKEARGALTTGEDAGCSIKVSGMVEYYSSLNV